MRTVVPARPGDERPRDGPDEPSLLSRSARRRKAAAPKVGRHVVVFIISALFLLPLLHHISVFSSSFWILSNAFDFYAFEFDSLLYYCVFEKTTFFAFSPKKSVTGGLLLLLLCLLRLLLLLSKVSSFRVFFWRVYNTILHFLPIFGFNTCSSCQLNMKP